MDGESEIQEEIETLRAEYAWVLREEVHSVLHEVHTMLSEACKRFPIQLYNGTENTVRPDKFVMTNSNGSQMIKCIVTLMADTVCEADLTLKINKSHTSPFQCKLYPDNPWRIQQIQDAGNHLLVALSHAESIDPDHHFTSAQQVVHILDSILECLNRGRRALALPKKKKLEELVKNPQLKGFKPSLPGDVVLSFYVHAQKLLLSVYHLYVNPNQKVDIQTRYQLECSVPWLNEVLVLFTLALQICQQLRDKISLFVQYEAETKFSSRPLSLSPSLDPSRIKPALQEPSQILLNQNNLIDFDKVSSELQQPSCYPENLKPVAVTEDGSDKADQSTKKDTFLFSFPS